MTTSDQSPTTEKRGRHARSEDDVPDDAAADARADSEERPTEDGNATAGQAADDDAEAADDAGDPASGTADEPQQSETPPPPATAERPARRRSRFRLGGHALHPLGHHPAGVSLLMSAALLTGLALAPVVFDQLDFRIAERAADTARSAAASWPGGGEPWFWPSWVALLAAVVAVVLLVLGFTGVRLPDLAVLALGVVLAVATARAAWATLAVVNSRLWHLLPVCLICLLAFGLAISGAARWRSPDEDGKGRGAGGAAGVVVGGWVLALLILIGGATIANVQESGLGPPGPPQDVAGLLSVRSADAPALDDLRGGWVAQVAAAEVGDDDAAATAFSAAHRDATTRFPAVLARGDDVGIADDRTWLTLAGISFADQAAAQAWCTANAVPGCTAQEVSG
ncbi:UNVERIFIED_ORG: hypothetical protein E4P37_18095 [Bacillus sp. AZ43]